jgi:hypothetical protein
MYHPGNTQVNPLFASMQRSFYPKHCNYYGDGQGRDSYVISKNGGLINANNNIVPKTGVLFQTYNTPIQRR